MEGFTVPVSFRQPSSGCNLMIHAYSPWWRCSHFTISSKGQLLLVFGPVISLLGFYFL